MRRSFLTLIIIIGLLNCKKETINIGSFGECNASQNFDSSTIAINLIGTWEWYQQTCPGNYSATQTNRNIIATFNSDFTFTVNENSNVLTQGTWKIEKADSDFWQLNLSPMSEFLSGRILFCDNQVLFNASIFDGCDNVFNKID